MGHSRALVGRELHEHEAYEALGQHASGCSLCYAEMKRFPTCLLAKLREEKRTVTFREEREESRSKMCQVGAEIALKIEKLGSRKAKLLEKEARARLGLGA